MKLKDKVVLVTGASRGIGRATALLCAREGARVIVNFKNSEKEALSLVKQINKITDSIAVQADVSRELDVKKLVKTSLDKYKRIDVLINNAGEIIRPGDWKSDLATWQKTIDINLTGSWLTIREIASLMLERKSGSIVNVSSYVASFGSPFVTAYASAKGGLTTLTKSFAKALAPHVRVNAVIPGNIDTEMTRSAGVELVNKFIDQTPLHRLGSPEEIAKAIVFLSSPDAGYITGETLLVDGGYSLK